MYIEDHYASKYQERVHSPVEQGQTGGVEIHILLNKLAVGEILCTFYEDNRVLIFLTK